MDHRRPISSSSSCLADASSSWSSSVFVPNVDDSSLRSLLRGGVVVPRSIKMAGTPIVPRG